MNVEDLKHRLLIDTALPYITNSSLIDPNPQYISPSSNVLTSTKGYAELRPGFPAYTLDDFGNLNQIVNYFGWQRWDGSFFVMVNVIDTNVNTSKVYKQEIGVDGLFQLLVTSAANVIPFAFTAAHNFVFFCNGTTSKKYDGTTVTSWGVTGITTAPTLSNTGAGNVPGVIGHTYVFAGGNSTTGYVTDISNPSLSTSAASRTWDVTGSRYTDTYIDVIHVYRTEDGGSVWRELSNSPIANPGAGSWTITDNNADTSLKATQAPLLGINAAPPTGLKGVTPHVSRLWGFVNDTLYWSALEEATNNLMPEEGFPTNNKRRFGRQILALAEAGNFLLIYTSSGIFKVSGFSPSTFVWDILSPNHGIRNILALDTDKTTAIWLDISNTILASDGMTISFPDISYPIRPDIAAINHSKASLCIYTANQRNWIILSDGGAIVIRIFDLDRRQWMPLWNLAAGARPTAVKPIEISAGTWVLMLGQLNGTHAKPLKLDESGSITSWADEGGNYSAQLYTNLISLVPDINPAYKGILQYVGTERSNDQVLSGVSYVLDDDPGQSAFVSVFTTAISTNPGKPLGRTFKTYLIEEWWWTKLQTACRRASVKLLWAASGVRFKLYSIDLSFTDYHG